MHTNLTERDHDRPVLIRLELFGDARGPAEIELLVTRLFDAGATGVEEQNPAAGPYCLVCGFPNRALAQAFIASVEAGELDRAGAIGRTPPKVSETSAEAARTIVAAALVEVPDDTWLDGWRSFARSHRAGQRLVIHPAWLIPQPEVDGLTGHGDDVVLEIDPGRSFGSGAHATTRLVLAELERLVTAGGAVLDVGSGSGVLSVAAARLGAGRVVAVDTDPAARRATSENLARNGVTGEIREDLPTADRFDLVVANIGANTLIELAPRLVALGDTVTLAGFLDSRAEAVVRAYQALGARLERRVEEPVEDFGGAAWVALSMRTPPQ